LPLILLHDGDPKKHGAPLAELHAVCAEEHRSYVFGEGDARPVIPWHRVGAYQLISLKQVAVKLLSAAQPDVGEPRLYLPGELSRCALRMPSPVRLWVSDANKGARSVAEELVAMDRSMLSVVSMPSRLRLPANDDCGRNAAMLLYLNDQTFSDPQLAEDVRSMLKNNEKIVLAHENDAAKGGCEFATFFCVTPQDIIDSGLYGPLAVALHLGDEHRTVSLRLLALALGARVVDSRRMRNGRRLASQLCGRVWIRHRTDPQADQGLPQHEMRLRRRRSGLVGAGWEWMRRTRTNLVAMQWTAQHAERQRASPAGSQHELTSQVGPEVSLAEVSTLAQLAGTSAELERRRRDSNTQPWRLSAASPEPRLSAAASMASSVVRRYQALDDNYRTP
jgi:hypothetical protein